MYYSITFETAEEHYKKNTWNDWGLIPISRPVINPPSVKQKKLEVPGRDGSIDLSSALTGYLNYENRTGSFEFYVDYNKTKQSWQELYNDLLNYLNGNYIFMYLEDDPLWYYRGTAIVNQWRSNNDGTGSRVVIDYDVEPYKLFYKSTDIGNTEFDLLEMNSGPIFERIFKISLPTDYNYTDLKGTRWYIFDAVTDYNNRRAANLFQHEQKPQPVTLVVSNMTSGSELTVNYWRNGRKADYENNWSDSLVSGKVYNNGIHTMHSMILGPYYHFEFQMITGGAASQTAKCDITIKFTPGRL